MKNIVKHSVVERSGLKILPESIGEITYYHVHSRIVSSMRAGNIFLIGDSAHVFYPAGGYGLNVAIKEAFLLGRALYQSICKGDTHELDLFSQERLNEAKMIQLDAKAKREHSMDIEKKENIIEKQVYQSTNN